MGPLGFRVYDFFCGTFRIFGLGFFVGPLGYRV